MQAAELYLGDFTAKTKNPVMLVNGIYDPVTPWNSAVNMSSGFEGAGSLKHRGAGHGVNVHPSVCTGKAIRAYFAEGVVPEEGTVCEPDVGVWELESGLEGILDGLPPGAEVEGLRKRGMPEEDVRLWMAMREMGKREAVVRRTKGVELGELV
jgi:hypothetical protein